MGTRGNPTDASGAVRPGPRAQTEAAPTFFRNSKLIPRFWAAGGRQVVTLRAEIWKDPAAWGLMLEDFAKHVANAHEQLGKRTKREIRQEIKQEFDVEWNKPTAESVGAIENK